jgi:two-component system, response regulator YesN
MKMYNLLIADDEELERRTIRGIIIKGFEEIFNIYEAKNGREAIEIADRIKPDIIIMDIKMPGINGIEAIKEIRKFLKEGYFIILTAYDYFDYAKEAIEYDVKEYILKPFKRNEFITKLEEAIRFVENIKLKRRDEIVLKEKIYTLIPMMENELCFSIISENLNNVDYKTYLGYLGMKFENGYCIVLRISSATDEKNKINMKFKVNDFAREYLKRQNNAISSCTFTDDIIIFIEIEKGNEVNEGLSSIETAARKIIDSIKEKFNLQIFVGIGRIYSGIERLSRSYKEALITVNSSNEEFNIRHFKDLVIANNNLEAIAIAEKNLFLVNDIEVFDEGKNIIMNAVEYINNNYKRDIMLEEVANYINISSFYFSKIFKEYTGKNYIDYITDLRIEIAKEKLRQGGTSIKEICYEVGYNDPNYFSRVFKKSEGLSPTDYKVKYAGSNK